MKNPYNTDEMVEIVEKCYTDFKEFKERFYLLDNGTGNGISLKEVVDSQALTNNLRPGRANMSPEQYRQRLEVTWRHKRLWLKRD